MAHPYNYQILFKCVQELLGLGIGKKISKFQETQLCQKSLKRKQIQTQTIYLYDTPMFQI